MSASAFLIAFSWAHNLELTLFWYIVRVTHDAFPRPRRLPSRIRGGGSLTEVF